MTQPPNDTNPSRSRPVTPDESALSMRVSDADRQAALQALGVHHTAGRLTLDEYGERSANIMVATTAGDFAKLFADLPAPHPSVSQVGIPGSFTPRAGTVAAPPAGATPARGAWQAPWAASEAAPWQPSDSVPSTRSVDQRSKAQRIVAAVASLSVFVALALFFTTGSWLWFLLIPGISGVAQALWGQDWKEPPGPKQLGHD